MHPLTLVSTVYGEARGYRRLSIRRRVAANERMPRSLLFRIADDEFQRHVHRCIASFPFYAERVKAHRGSLPKPDERVRPEELPVWTRSDQREFFHQQERPADSHYVHQTSGSTGQLSRFHVTRESYEWRTAVMDRVYAWAGAQEGVKSVHVWGSGSGVPAPLTRIKRRVHLALQRRYFIEAYREFTDVDRIECCELINRIRPRAIVGYTGMLVDLARFARDNNALEWRAASVITTAEGLRSGQRELIQRHLGEHVFDSYGSREFMNIGTECEYHRGYHLAWDNLRIEVVDAEGMPLPPGQPGRVVVTDLHNSATPFIRYEVGDVATMADPDEVCACGRPFPLLLRVEGREQEVIHTPRGAVHALFVNYAVRGFDWVDGYQVVQHSPHRILIRLLVRGELTTERQNLITTILQRELPDMTIDYERASELWRRPNGKVAVVVSKVARLGGVATSDLGNLGIG